MDGRADKRRRPSSRSDGGHAVICVLRTKDRYGRKVALGGADGQDLGAAMVRAGMVWPFTRYSSDFVEQERAAIGERAGVHEHDCEMAWDWRAGSRGGH